MHVMFVQYAGDYREAVQRFEAGGEENYGYQRFSVDAVAELTHQFDRVSVLCFVTSEPYCEILNNGVQAIGLGAQEPSIEINKIIQTIEAQNPDRLIIRTPFTALLRWVIQKKIPTLALFADSFQQKGIKSRIKNFLLAQILNNTCIEWVSNHNIDSCMSLKKIGVSPRKILPWDWPALKTPESSPVKQLDNTTDHQIFYAGMLSEAKGVGDLLNAVAQLKKDGITVKLMIAGGGDRQVFTQQVQQLQIEENVQFLGLIPNHQVISMMEAASAVVVPSRTEYPEGMPNTISEALCTRTPIVMSNHPVFQRIFKHEKNAMIFESGDPNSLAQCLRKVLETPDLYAHLSESSLQAWNQLQTPLKWDVLVNTWLQATPEGRTALGRYALIH